MNQTLRECVSFSSGGWPGIANILPLSLRSIFFLPLAALDCRTLLLRHLSFEPRTQKLPQDLQIITKMATHPQSVSEKGWPKTTNAGKWRRKSPNYCKARNCLPCGRLVNNLVGLCRMWPKIPNHVVTVPRTRRFLSN